MHLFLFIFQAIWLLCTGAREAAFRNIKTIAECLADELINAAKVRSLPRYRVYLPSVSTLMTCIVLPSLVKKIRSFRAACALPLEGQGVQNRLLPRNVRYTCLIYSNLSSVQSNSASCHLDIDADSLLDKNKIFYYPCACGNLPAQCTRET